MATLKGLMTTLSKKGLQEQRGEIIYNFTGGRTSSARDLTPQELEDLCNALQGIKKSKTQLMSECLKILELEGIHRPHEPILEEDKYGRIRPNPWGHLNRWMKERSVYKKPLPFYTIVELEVLRKQLYALASNNRKSAKKPLNKAWWRQANDLKDLN